MRKGRAKRWGGGGGGRGERMKCDGEVTTTKKCYYLIRG